MKQPTELLDDVVNLCSGKNSLQGHGEFPDQLGSDFVEAIAEDMIIPGVQ